MHFGQAAGGSLELELETGAAVEVFDGGGGGGFGSAMCGVSSDQYSFLDMDSEQLNTKGNGGTRQMHNYVSLDHSDTIQTPADDHDYKNEQGTEEGSFEKMQQQRDSDLSNISYNTKV